MAQALAQAGYENVRFLRGGYDAWVQAGYPLETKEKEARKAA